MMGRRILGIELRRSAAVGTGLLVLVVGAGLLLTAIAQITGRWIQLTTVSRSLLMILMPLALAGGAWLGRREPRSRVGELFASTARPRWQRMLPTAGALAITVASAYVLMVAVGAVWVVPTAGYFPISVLGIIAVSLLGMIAAGWLGMSIGRVLPHLVTAPVLAVVAFAVVGLLPDYISVSAYQVQGADPKAGSDGNAIQLDPAVLLLNPVNDEFLDDFETFMGQVTLAQVMWLAALAVTALLLLGAARRRTAALATLPAVLGAAVALPFFPLGAYDKAVEVDPQAVELVCDDNGPQVCVTRVHSHMLPDVVGPAREALAMMAAKLPNAPTKAVENQQPDPRWYLLAPDEYPPERRYPGDTLVIAHLTNGPYGGQILGTDEFLRSLLEAAWWQGCQGPTMDGEVLGLAVGAALLAGRPPVLEEWWGAEERQRADRAYQALTALPEAEQRDRMAAAREKVLECHADAFAPLMLSEES